MRIHSRGFKKQIKKGAIIAWRSNLVFGAFFIVAVLILKEFFIIQVIQRDFYTAEAQKNQYLAEKLFPTRGDIYMIEKTDKDIYQVAFNSEDTYSYKIFIDTSRIKDFKETFVDLYSEKLFLDKEYLSEKVNIVDDPYVVITRSAKEDLEKGLETKLAKVTTYVKEINSQQSKDRNSSKSKLDSFIGDFNLSFFVRVSYTDGKFDIVVDKEEENYFMDGILEELIDADIPGVYFQPIGERIYPNGSLASQLIGFTSYKEGEELTGQYGIEQYYNNELKGKKGEIIGKKDGEGNWIIPSERTINEAENGYDIVLTMDRMIQFMVEDKLKKAIEKYKATQGTIIIMNPQDGGILAMANYPTYDPNEYSLVENQSLFLNSAIHTAYEPGSIFKPLTIAAAIDSGSITPNTKYRDVGYYQPKDFDERPIKNADNVAYGEVTMTQVTEKSINTGAIFAVNQMGKEKFLNYVEDFGVGEKTGIDLISEQNGNITSLYNLQGDVNFATASFGQGITVTPLGILTAISAIANRGNLLRPHVIDKMVSPSGAEEVYESSESAQVISESTSAKVIDMLVSSVENGYASTAKIDGYKIAGKTGTAQISDKEKGGYLKDETIHSFVGFFPAYEAQFAILIKLDRPKGVEYSMDSVGPVFKDIASYLIDYYNIPPE